MAKSKSKKTISNKKVVMKETKTKTAKAVKVIKKLRPIEEAKTVTTLVSKKVNYSNFVKLGLVVAVGVVVFLLAQKYRGLILAGTVNNIPVTRFELNQRMASKYGADTFDEIVSDRLLNQELQKNNIVVTSAEVDAEMAKVIKDYGGADAFKAALSQYKMTEATAKDSIKQSLGLKKMIEKTYKIEVTDADIQKYFNDNQKLFVGKKLADVSASIKDTLYQQQVYTKSQEWFANIRKAAKVVSFI